MDLMTHAMFPSSFAAVLNRNKTECAAVLLGGISPDFDIFISWIGYLLQNPIFFHRGITHTFLFGIPTAAIVLYIFSSRKRAGVVKKLMNTTVELKFDTHLFLFAYAGLLAHLFLDSLTSRGIPLLYPLTAKRYTLEIFFYIDFYLMALGMAILVYLIFRMSRTKDFIRLAKNIFVIYLVVFLAVASVRLYEKNIALGSIEAPEKAAYATPSPFSWLAVGQDSSTINIYVYDSANRNATYFRSVEKLKLNGNGATFPFDDALARAKALPDVRDFLLNARAVAIDAYFDKSANEWVIDFTDPTAGAESAGLGASRLSARSIHARVSETQAV